MSQSSNPSLPESARRFVADRVYRAQITRRILQPDSGGLVNDLSAVQELDEIVTAILTAVDLPRGPHVRGPFVDLIARGWAGRKAPDCRLLLDRATFLDLPEDARTDALLKTWVHESLHGRQPYAAGFAAEWRDLRGFEEGMVEGLARFVVCERLGLTPLLASYSYYVEAYHALAKALAVPIVDLWRELWLLPAGEVAGGLLRALENVLRVHGRSPLTLRQRARLLGQARSAFASVNSTREPDETALLASWQGAMQ